MNIKIDIYYSSLQLRAKNTLNIIQKILDEESKSFSRIWQLNERHYGALTGLNKIETINKIGKEKVHEFRRSWDIRPDPLEKESPYHPSNIILIKISKVYLIQSLKILIKSYNFMKMF